MQVVQAALKVQRSIAEKLIHDAAVQCRGRIISQTHFRLDVGDELEIDYAPQPVKTPRKKSKTSMERFEVVHDDESIIVVTKPAWILTVPSLKRENNTLLSQVTKWTQANQAGVEAICVHRLDRGVSGLLVFAKSREIADALRDQFAARKPRRKYTAIVQGRVEDQQGSIQNYLTTDEKTLTRYSTEDPNGGELAITHYVVKDHWKDTTLVEVQLETGRRNQIRVHLAELGHPILGDPRYRPQEAEHQHWPYKRLALHAETLGFVHPVSGESLLFKAPWPQEFRDFQRKMRPKRSGK